MSGAGSPCTQAQLRDVDNAIRARDVRSLPLPQLLEELSPPFELDVLQVDTEGFDHQVIYNADVDRLRPRVINFEMANLSAERSDALKAFLEARDYVVSAQAGDALAIRAWT